MTEDQSEYLRIAIVEIVEEFQDLKPLQNRFSPGALMEMLDLIPFDQFIRALHDSGRFQGKELPVADTQHDLWIPCGPALVAFLHIAYSTENGLQFHPNQGIRLIVAFGTHNKIVLDQLSYDRCILVRREVLRNIRTPRETRDRLDGDRLSPIECVCFASEASDDCEFFFESKGLDIPALDENTRAELREFREWQWATQPYPTPIQDYMLQSVEYLKGPVPDQYAVNHEGHGINSYSLNFRCVSGDIAIMAQVGYGGMYGDIEEDKARWNNLVMRLTSILVQSFQEDDPSIRVRKYLLVYSTFRLENDFQLFIHKDGSWHENKDFSDFDDACTYIIEKNQ